VLIFTPWLCCPLVRFLLTNCSCGHRPRSRELSLPFYRSQLGRFGDLGATLTPPAEPDLMAAHLYAANGSLVGGRPSLQQVLSSKGLWDPSDPVWQQWRTVFGNLRNNYMAAGGHALPARCPMQWSSFPTGGCGHELTPPLSHWNLRGFSQSLPSRPDTVVSRPNGTLGVDEASKPMWLYIVTSYGEILVTAEDYEWIKHPCLAGGYEVWSAGQLGIERHEIRLVDLRSGHYIAPNIGATTALARRLLSFTREVFEQYTRTLGVNCLHAQFDCIWA